MISLKPTKRHKNDSTVFRWTEAMPFFFNPRGILLHRVATVETMLSESGMERHHHCTYECGNGACFEVGGEDELFFENPPSDKLLCSRCEFVAVRRGERSASKIAGRHVHIGELRAHRTCCGGAKS